MKKILVTGGMGFIGSYLVKRLVQEGHYVRVLDNCFRGDPERLPESRYINARIGDIRIYEAVRECVRGMDIIFHLAFINGTQYFYERPELVIDVGVRGTLNIIEAAKEFGVKEIILTSSSETYQTPFIYPTPELVPLVVPDVLNPRYSYGGTKIINELMLLHQPKGTFERSIVVRPHNVYGPDMGRKHVIPEFILRMNTMDMESEEGEEIDFPIQGTGTETRAFDYIDDFIDALMIIFDNGYDRNIYNIGSEEEVTIKTLASLIGEEFNRPINIIPSKPAIGGTSRRVPDITKVLNLGHRNKISLMNGLDKTIQWYVKNANKSKSDTFMTPPLM